MYKQAFLAAVLFSTSIAQATPANFFQCSGNKATAEYVTQSLAGSSLSISFNGKNWTANNAGIGEQSTVLGRLLTLTLDAVPDSRTDTLTLLLPDVNVADFGNNHQKSFRTRLYSTQTRTTFGGPALVDGVVQDNASVALICKASAAVF